MRFRKRAGRCYELSWRHLIWGDRFIGGSLVHGEVRGRVYSRIAHAWLERDTATFDPVRNEFYDTAIYRMRFEAATIKKYSQLEAAEIGPRLGHYGPWED